VRLSRNIEKRKRKDRKKRKFVWERLLKTSANMRRLRKN
jgi:hypothetical protein